MTAGQRDRARAMRREPTPAEARLWQILRREQLGVRFRRQEPIGPYIVDFVCFEQRLIIEADGGQHAENPHDARRDVWLRGQGFRLLRFWNQEILEATDMVEQLIIEALRPLPGPPP